MSQPSHTVAPRDRWTVAVYEVVDSRTWLIGSGVVIDDRRIITCAHVVKQAFEQRRQIRVSFPKAGGERVSYAVDQVRFADATDVAVLRLADPVPARVRAAPLRIPEPASLAGERWWSFGLTKEPNSPGAAVHGVIGDALAWGFVALMTGSRERVRSGFSGAGIWCERYQAVVGIIGQAREGGEHPGDALGISMHQIAQDLPEEKIGHLAMWTLPSAGEEAIAAWGWSLSTDDEARRHWRPRARGVSVDSESGHRFRGRTAALTEIVRWLDRAVPDRRVLVVTGSPGVGKSAVLGRIVTTADAEVRASLPASDQNVKARIGTVACAIHAKSKSAIDVAAELARAASVRIPREVDDLVPALREELLRRGHTRLNIVVDALDEASTPVQVRDILSRILLPLVQTCSDVGAQVVIGTRRSDDGGDLIKAIGTAGEIVNLDAPAYFADEDLAAYAQATLQLVGDERPGNPYQADEIAMPVARRIAALARQNFLIAGLVARNHGMFDVKPVVAHELSFTPTVDDALSRYLERLPPVGQTPAATVFTALAYAPAYGLPTSIWSVVLESLAATVSQGELAHFVGTSAANFLVESSGEGDVRRYRLFHQALNDALLRRQEARGGRSEGERLITRALIAYGRRHEWSNVDSYLYQALPVHADRVGLIDELLNDNDYLLHADLRRLTPLADRAVTPQGQARGKLLRLTPLAIPASPAERAGLLNVTQVMERLGPPLEFTSVAVPYRAGWADVIPRSERILFGGHGNPVNVMCTIFVEGRAVLATGGDDWAVRLWEASTGVLDNTMRGHEREITMMCPLELDDRHHLLVTVSKDFTVRIWDPDDAVELSRFDYRPFTVTSICAAVGADGVPLAILGCGDGKVRTWNYVTNGLGEWDPAQSLPADDRSGPRPVGSLATVRFRDTTAVVVAARTNVTVHDLATGRLLQKARSSNPVSALAVVGPVRLASEQSPSVHVVFANIGGELESMELRQDGGNDWSDLRTIPLLSGGGEVITGLAPIASVGKILTVTRTLGKVELIDFVEGETVGTIGPDTPVAVCPVKMGGRPHVAIATRDGTVRLWDPDTHRQESLTEANSVRSFCRFPVFHGREVVVGIQGRMIKLWSATDGRVLRSLKASTSTITGVSFVPWKGAPMLAASAMEWKVRLWSLPELHPEPPLEAYGHEFSAICTIPAGRGLLLAVGSRSGDLLIWRLHTGLLARGIKPTQQHQLRAHRGPVTALCPLRTVGGALLASAGFDGVIQIWDPARGRAVNTFETPGHVPRSLCPLHVGGQSLLASGGTDHTVRLWDPIAGRQVQRLNGHAKPVSAVAPIAIGGEECLASASEDATVRLWRLNSDEPDLIIPLYHRAHTCVAPYDSNLVVGLDAGILSLEFQPDRRV